MLFSGIMFTLTNLFSLNVSYNAALNSQTFIFMMIIPVLTMKLLSEDKRSKTDQLLLTSPVSVTSIILGKYFPAHVHGVPCDACDLACLPADPFIYGQPSFGEIFTGYIGFFLVGSALIAVGVFISSITESQVIAAITTFFILLLVWIGGNAYSAISNVFLSTIVKWVSVYGRLTEFLTGVLSLTGIIYFISYAAIFIFLTVRSVEKRRWSEG